MNTISDRFDLIMTKKNVGTIKLAKQVPICPSCVARFRTGTSLPSLKIFVSLVKLLNLNKDQLYWLVMGDTEAIKDIEIEQVEYTEEQCGREK